MKEEYIYCMRKSNHQWAKHALQIHNVYRLYISQKYFIIEYFKTTGHSFEHTYLVLHISVETRVIATLLEGVCIRYD